MTTIIVAFRNFVKEPTKEEKIRIKRLISTSCREAEDNCAILDHYVASSVNSLPTFRDSLSAPSTRVKNPLFGFLILKLEPI